LFRLFLTIVYTPRCALTWLKNANFSNNHLARPCPHFSTGISSANFSFDFGMPSPQRRVSPAATPQEGRRSQKAIPRALIAPSLRAVTAFRPC
jgi:hypothetical protein